jgi:hypothetical protein
VTFAWLGADPPPRLALWRKEDLEERLKIHREFAAAGEQLIPDAEREQMERDIARLDGKAPDLASKAAMADKHWIPRIGGALRSNSLSSFRGFYTILFREHSGLVHATMRGLNHVTVDLAAPGKRVVLEAPLGGEQWSLRHGNRRLRRRSFGRHSSAWLARRRRGQRHLRPLLLASSAGATNGATCPTDSSRSQPISIS